VNFFQRFRAKRTDQNQAASIASPSLPKEEKNDATDDAQYASLVRALRPKIERALRDLQLDAARSNFPTVVGGANKPPPANPDAAAPDPPPDAPIV
jgi:hypothetical protein